MSLRLFLLVLSATTVFAQNRVADSLASLPTSPQRIVEGQGSNESGVTTYGVVPLGLLGSFNAGDGAFQILALPNGSKYYVISHSAANTVMSLDTNLQKTTLVANFPTPASAAAITPDGSKLLVANGSLHIFSTAKDNELVSGGITLNGYSINDVAVSLDGQTAYALGSSNTGEGWQVAAVNLSGGTSCVCSTQGQPEFGESGGIATAVAVSPSGLVYVSWQNQIVELNPATLTLVSQTVSAIGVDGDPGKLVFSPDGVLGLAVNTQPSASYAMFVINLKTHIPNPIRSASFSLLSGTLDTILVANTPVANSTNTLYTAFAYSTSSQTLWEVGIDSTGTNVAANPAGQPIGGINPTSVTGVALSNELPSVSNNVGANYIYIGTTSGVLYQILHPGSTSSIVNQLPNQPLNGALQYIGLPSSGPAVTLLQYGITQQVVPGGNSLPLVVRAIDGKGKPVMGVPISFSASVNTATLSATTATTGSDGFAVTTLTAPNLNNIPPIVVTATTSALSTQKFTFEIQVGSSTTTTAGSLSIVAGQGQLLTSSAQTVSGASPLEVVLNDPNGNPLANQTVNFKGVNLPGTLTVAQGFAGTVTTTGVAVTTNAKGQAWANYNPQVIHGPTVQSTITAQAPNSNTVTFYETAWDPSFPPSINLTHTSPQPGAAFTTQVGVKQQGAFAVQVFDVSTGLPIGNVSVGTCIPGQLVASGKGFARPCAPPAAGTPTVFADCDPTTDLSSPTTGVATCDLIPRTVTGSINNFGFAIGNLENFAPYTLTVNPGPPAAINIISGNNQTGKPGQQLPAALVAQVVDIAGNQVGSGVAVAWSVLPAGVPATLQSTSSATAPNGEASTLVTLGNTAGTVLVQVTATSPLQTASQTFSLTVVNPAAGIQVVSGNNQNTLVSTNFAAPIVVGVVDGQGNPVNGAPVTFALTSGSATIGTASTTTNSSGQASTTVTAGASAGNIVITAATGTFSVTFSLSSHLPGPQNIIFVNGASFLLQSNCPSPGCVAPGEVVTIDGSGFATGVQGVMSGTSLAGPLPTTLAGASITFNGVAAPIFYIANVNGVESMSVQVPFETQPGNATVVLTGAGGGSANLNVTVNPFAPGIFTTAYGNQIVAVAVRPDGSYVSPTNPAHLGETIYLFVTGLGATSPAATTGAQGASQAVTGTVITGLNNGGVPHGTVYYAPGLVGVYIVPMEIPTTITTGPSQPVGLVLVDPSSGTKYFAGHANIPIIAQ